MNKLTGHISRKVVYDPWELCGLDNVCKRPCLGCKIPNIIFKLMRYEDTGWEPEELNKKILHEYAYGWIPCSERLPENARSVMVSKEDNDVAEAYYDTKAKKWTQYRWSAIIHPIAWAEKQEPYKERKMKKNLCNEDYLHGLISNMERSIHEINDYCKKHDEFPDYGYYGYADSRTRTIRQILEVRAELNEIRKELEKGDWND